MFHSFQRGVLKAFSARKGEVSQRVRVSVMSQAHFQKLMRSTNPCRQVEVVLLMMKGQKSGLQK